MYVYRYSKPRPPAAQTLPAVIQVLYHNVSSCTMAPALWCLAFTYGAVTNPNYLAAYTSHATALRAALLANYDKGAPPTSQRAVDYSEAGTDVQLNVRFYKLDEVNVASGTISYKVWFRLRWIDSRLAWDPAQYGGITEVRFQGASYSAPEDSEIWLPDVTPYNAVTGLMNSLDPAPALVQSTGEVYWARPGTLSVMCRFSGLVMYPFDELSCPIEIGGWMSGGGLQGLTGWRLHGRSDGCVSFPTSEETSLTTYQEMSIVRIECHEEVYAYECCPNDPYPVIIYRVFLRRATFFYVISALVPLILFTLLSFSVFFISFEVGERLGVGVTLVLTIEFSRASLSANLPICGEWLYIEVLFFVNFLFSTLSLLESCIVLAVGFTESEHFLPKRFLVAVRAMQKMRFLLSKGGKKREPADNANAHAGISGDSIAGVLLRKRKGMAEGLKRATTASSTLFQSFSASTPSPPPSPPAPSGAAASDDAAVSQRVSSSDASKLLFFENLFFQLDVDGGGTITFDEIRRMLAFVALDMSTEDREQHLQDADVGDADGALDRLEFLDLCVSMLWSTPLEQLEAAAASYSEFRAALKRRLNAYWRGWAHYIDRQSRFWVPLLYVTTMLLFGIGISMEDDYRGRSRIERLDLDQENLAANKHFQSLNVTSEKYKSTFAPMREALDGIHFTLLPAAALPIVFFVVVASLFSGLGAWDRRVARNAQEEARLGARSRQKDLEAHANRRSDRSDRDMALGDVRSNQVGPRPEDDKGLPVGQSRVYSFNSVAEEVVPE